jgi:hypothetical protein
LLAVLQWSSAQFLHDNQQSWILEPTSGWVAITLT